MPDALPPVGVLLATLDAATTPLAGTESVFVMQGGQPKRTTVSSIGGGGGYVLPGTYEPSGTLNGSADFVVVSGDGGEGQFGFLRTGSGPGPRAGDVVTVFGTLNAFNVDNGGSFSVGLRFLADISTVAPAIDVSTGASGCSVTAGLSLGANLQLVFSTPGPDHFVGAVPVRITYQTANAVDP